MIGASVTDYVKTAFHIYSHRAGDNRPWEHLSDREQQAWGEAISWVQDALEEEHDRVPCCPACNAEMACPNCDADDDDGKERGLMAGTLVQRAPSPIEGRAMRPYSIDEHWDVLCIAYRDTGRRMPWLDRVWYRAALCWLRWRLRRASAGALR